MYIKLELAGHQIQDAIAEYVLKTTGTKMADDVPPWIHCIDDKKRPKDLVDIDESIFCSLFIKSINKEGKDNFNKQKRKSE